MQADGDRWTENKTGTNTETAESDELASRLLEELRDDDDDADAPSRTDGDERDDGSDALLAAAPPVVRAAARVVHRVRRPVQRLGELRELSLVVHAKRPRGDDVVASRPRRVRRERRRDGSGGGARARLAQGGGRRGSSRPASCWSPP
jgi:hypothetical protein